jgi:hypothetical protein
LIAGHEVGMVGERREWQRIDVQWPALLFRTQRDTPIECLTGNLSSNGVLLVSAEPFAVGECFHCRIDMPAHNPRNGNAFLSCLVQVVRVERDVRGGFGIACKIQDYQIVSV